MGYRSDTALCLSDRAMTQFNQRLNTAEKQTAEAVRALVDSADKCHCDSKTNSRLWYWDSVKWYPDYDDVKFVEELIGELDMDDFLFIRIGEDADDNEVWGSYYDNPFGMYLVRRIEFSPAEEKACA